MIEIVYSAKIGIDLSGSPQELREIMQTILSIARSERTSVTMPANSDRDPHPYDVCLRQITIRRKVGLARVFVTEENSMEIEGSGDGLELLASYFDVKDNAKFRVPNNFEGHKWISPDSEPLVISVRKANT